MKQQEIAWVKIPFSDFSETKLRPALIVSNNDYNSKAEDIVVCAITSNIQKAEYSVQLSQKDFIEGNLPIESRIKADKIMQINKKLTLRAFAKISEKKFDETIAEIKKLLAKK
ncbi:MAG: type II toxin-antitoxin system PemK/MazF family toxin [Candidatus Diapherotrites archaeon]|nr:type II toxin-antitoxin system PemK/MazF family toxin [Candidatus Diapherotrites archaeon]